MRAILNIKLTHCARFAFSHVRYHFDSLNVTITAQRLRSMHYQLTNKQTLKFKSFFLFEPKEVVREKWIYKTSENNDAITKVEDIITLPVSVFKQEELISEKIMSLKDDPIAQQFMAEMAMYEGR